MDANECRQQPLPVELRYDERIRGHGQIFQLGGLMQGIDQVGQGWWSGRWRRFAVRSFERGDVHLLGRENGFDIAAGACGKTRGRERGVMKCGKDGGVVSVLDVLLGQEQAKELTVRLKRERRRAAGESASGEYGSASGKQTATAWAASDNHRMVLPYTGGQVN